MTTTTTTTHTTLAKWQCEHCDYHAEVIRHSGLSLRCTNSNGTYWGFSHATDAEAVARFNRVFVATHECHTPAPEGYWLPLDELLRQVDAKQPKDMFGEPITVEPEPAETLPEAMMRLRKAEVRS